MNCPFSPLPAAIQEKPCRKAVLEPQAGTAHHDPGKEHQTLGAGLMESDLLLEVERQYYQKMIERAVLLIPLPDW